MERKSLPRSFHHSSQSGLSLIETVIAIAMLFVASGGIMSMAIVATLTTENQGHLAARTIEYAQDKLEQLIALLVKAGLLEDRLSRKAADFLDLTFLERMRKSQLY